MIMFKVFLSVLMFLLVSACDPKVGSYEWCERVAHDDKSGWSDDQIAMFSNNCFVEH